MAHPWMMGHTGWLVVFVFIYGFRSGLCDISLTMEKTITGYKRDTVVIPCTYTASKDKEVTKIEWEFKNDPVIYRTDDQDHIPLVKYRNRVELSKSLPGDVSLTLRRLDTDDRGNFKCKVTGRDTSGKRIMQESVTILKVLRTRPPTEEPQVTTAEAEVTTRTSSEDDSAIARTKQPRKFHASSVPAYPFTSNVVNDNAPAEAIKSSGIFFYMLIIGLLCIASVLILAIVLIARRKRKSFDYNIPTMNQLALNLEGHSSEPASNNYEPAFPVSQYESLPMCSNIYEQLVLKNLEGNDSKSQTSQ